jgi:type I restriction enzyme S subunit
MTTGSADKWRRMPLAALLRPVSRPEAVQPEREYAVLGAHWYAKGLYTKVVKLGSAIQARTLYQVRAGDFVYNRLFAWMGSFAVASVKNDGCHASNEFLCFDVDRTQILPEYLWCYFSRPTVWKEALGLSTGSTPTSRNRLKQEQFLNLQIALPPLSEQATTVARLDRAKHLLERAEAARKSAGAKTDALMGSVLDRVFGDPYEGRRGRVDGDLARLGDAAVDVADGPHATPTYLENGVPFITVLNIVGGTVDFTGAKFISQDAHAQYRRRATAERGDVMISKDGTIGIPCVVDTDREFSFFVSVALVKPDRAKLDGHYLAWAIRAPYMQRRIRERSRGDMIRHLVLREIRELVLPIPSIAEQRSIAQGLSALQSRLAVVKEHQATVGNQLDAIVPSLMGSLLQPDKAERVHLRSVAPG